MTPLTVTSGVRATAADWAYALADRLTDGTLTRRAARLEVLEQEKAKLTGERNTSRDAAEDAWASRDRVRGELSDARNDLARIGRTLAERNVIPPTGGPHLVWRAVEQALGPDADAPIATVADTVAIAVRNWTSQPGKAGLLEEECTELGWVAAASVAPFLRDDLAAAVTATTTGEQPA